MTRISLALLGLLVMSVPFSPPASHAAEPATSTTVHFSPRGGCMKALLRAFGEAEREIQVIAGTFRSEGVAKGLIDARRRGVKVTIILDVRAAQDPESVAARLQEAEVTVLVDAIHPACHSRNIVIDANTVLTGGFELTREAELREAGTLVILRDQPVIAGQFIAHFNQLKANAQPYVHRPARPDGPGRAPTAGPRSNQRRGNPGTPESPDQSTAPSRIDPNVASAAVLQSIKGIGPVLASNIIAYREEHARPDRPAFTCVEDLINVARIGPKTAQRLAPFMTFPEKTKAHPAFDPSPAKPDDHSP